MSTLALYQLSANYLKALESLTDPELDLPSKAINDTLESLSGELEDKAVNVAKFLRNMETMAEAIKNAEADMAKRRKALENRIQWLKTYLKDNMENCGLTKIECPYFKLSVQNNPEAVHIVDENAIPDQFKREVITWKIDKAEIRKAIQSGQKVAGAHLISSTHLVIR
jgi:hypothetical protein